MPSKMPQERAGAEPAGSHEEQIADSTLGEVRFPMSNTLSKAPALSASRFA